MDSRIDASGGTKRAAPSLLPAFEPLSSSPLLPRPLKRANTGQAKYPTPVPTSSTGILSSSPPRRRGAGAAPGGGPERAPLSAVRAVELPESGETVCLGRSSHSSHLQLSANRLVSRVHVRARFVDGRVEIVCCGWNGLRLHCQGRSWDLLRGDSFTSGTAGTDVLVDVLDARVMIQWPRRAASLSDSSWESPLRRASRIASPESPTPAGPRDPGIEIYEDEAALPEPRGSSPADDGDDPDEENDPIVHSFGPFGADISGRVASITTKSPAVLGRHRKCDWSPTKAETKAEAEEVEVAGASPAQAEAEAAVAAEAARGAEAAEGPPSKTAAAAEIDPEVANHVVNQLAFSRLSSTPLSTMMHNMPDEFQAGLAPDVLRRLVESTPCIGIIARQGNDAAGKPLESEYYYIPERDDDQHRRAAVVDGLRKPSLRNCRKQHKQYYWKRPRTP